MKNGRKFNITLRGYVFILMIIFTNSLFSQALQLQKQDSLHIIQQLQSTIEEQKVLVASAVPAVDLQNKQIEQANDLLAIYFGLIGFSVALFALISYFQFWKPISEQKDEIKELSQRSRKILVDIDGTLQDSIQAKYEEYQNERLRKALVALVNTDTNTVGYGVLLEMQTIGMSENQLLIINDFLLRIGHMYVDDKYRIDVIPAIFTMISLLSKADKKEWLDKIFSNYFKSPRGSYIFYHPMSCEYTEYLAENMDSQDYEALLRLVSNIHPYFEGSQVEAVRLTYFKMWLQKIINRQPIVAVQILDNKYFVNEVKRLGIMSSIIAEYKKNGYTGDNYGTSTEKLQDTLFTTTLIHLGQQMSE